MHADRHETDGAVVRLYANGGVTEFAAGQIAGFEQDEEVVRRRASSKFRATQRGGTSNRGRESKWPAPDFVHSVVAAESGFRTNAVFQQGRHRPDAADAGHRPGVWRQSE